MMSTTGGARRSLAPAVAALAVAAMLLSGCAPEGTAEPDTESAKQQRAFPELYSQQLAWERCGGNEADADQLEAKMREAGARIDGMQCTFVEVPLNWSDSSSDETIMLRAMFIPATGESEPIGTLLSNPGGPGASGIEFAVDLTISPDLAEVQEHYNFLGFDPRGMGASSPLECESESNIFELQLAQCAEQNPLALSMGSAQVARDMELMRHLLGDAQLHYAGFSYGTVIGATYVTLFPERVGRVMLDSAWPSDWSSPLGSYQQREAVAAAIGELLVGCASEYQVESCPLDGEEALQQLVERLNAQPLLATDGGEVTGSMIRDYLTVALYQLPSGRHDLLDAVGRAVGGEQEAIDKIAAAMAGGGARVGLAGMVVRCLSSPRDPNLIGLYDYIVEHGLPRSLGGPEIDDSTLREYLNLSCDALPDSGEDYMMFSNESETPVLVFGLTGDHATPYAGAQQLVDELGNATLVTLEGSGHIASFQGRSTCADAIATAYLLRGEMPAVGTVCTDD